MSLYKSEYELTVSFEDLDPMNIVWHGNYVKYLEQARCNLLSKLNYNYMDMKVDGFAYPVAKMQLKYIKPCTLGDHLVIKTEILTLEPSLNMKYKIYNKKTNEKVCEAETMQIAVDMKTGESIYEPSPKFIKAIQEAFYEKN